MYTIILVIAQDRGEFEVMCKHKNIVQLHWDTVTGFYLMHCMLLQTVQEINGLGELCKHFYRFLFSELVLLWLSLVSQSILHVERPQTRNQKTLSNLYTVKTKGLFQSGYRSSQLHDFTYCRQQ